MTQEAIAEQVQIVRAELGDGKLGAEVVKEYAAKWGVCGETVRDRIRRAYAEEGKIDESRQQYERGKVLVQTEAVFAAAWAKGNHFACLKALELKAKLLGLNAPEVHELSLPMPWLEVFDRFGIRRPGNGKNGTQTGGDDAPEVRH